MLQLERMDSRTLSLRMRRTRQFPEVGGEYLVKVGAGDRRAMAQDCARRRSGRTWGYND
jgi:hypothetical protein